MSSVRVFVNGVAFDVAADSTAIAAVARANPAGAEEVRAGRRIITDSRGLAVAPDAPVFGGAIFRTARAKPPADASA